MRITADEPQLRSVNSALLAGAAVAAGSAATSYLTGFGCPLFEVTGRWCAFCGAARAVRALATGHLDTALRNNGLIILVSGLVVIRAVLLVTGQQGTVSGVDNWIERVDIRVWTFAILLWTVARNLPWLWFLGPAR